jgi:cytochrome c2
LRGRDEVWTPALLRSFLLDPQSRFAGTIMPPIDSEGGIEELIDFLKATEATPELP